VNELINEAIEVVNEHEFCKEMALNSIVADLKEGSFDKNDRPQALASFVPKNLVEASVIEISPNQFDERSKALTSKEHSLKKKKH